MRNLFSLCKTVQEVACAMSLLSAFGNFVLYFLLPATAYVFWWLHRRSSYWKDRNVPGPKPSWRSLAGTMTGVGSKVSLPEKLCEMYNEYKHTTSAVGMFMSVKPVLLITHPELARTILARDFSKFHDHGFYYNERDDPLSANLLNFEGAKWRMFRNKLSPAFTAGKIRMMYSSIEQIGDRFVDILNQFANDHCSFDVKNLSSRFTTDVLGSTAFGIEVDSLNSPDSELFKIIQKLMTYFTVNNPSFLFKMTFKDLSRKLRLPLIPRDFSSFFMKMLKETVDYREGNNVNRNDFLQLLLQLKNNGILDGETGEKESEKLTFDEIAAQAFIFFFAGFENSSSVLNLTLYQLACHKEIQDKARQEVLEKIAKHNGRLSYEALMEMEYLNQIFNETVRINPPVYLLIRMAAEDYTIPGTKMKVDKGTQVLISNYLFHMDPNFFPDPERFDPERFTRLNMARRHPSSFLGFGDGPRVCIGWKFAELQSRFAIALVLKNFKLSLDRKTKVPLEFRKDYPGWSVIDGIWLNVERVTSNSGVSTSL